MNDPFSTSPSDQGFSLGPDMRDARDELDQTGESLIAFRDNMRSTTQIGRQFGSAIGNAFEGLAFKGRGLGDTIRTLGMSLSRMAFSAAVKPLEQAFASGFTNLLSGGGIGGVPLSGVAQASAGVQLFAKGGVIASPVAFPLGQGSGIAGERGAEAIMPLARGPDGRLGVAASSHAGLSVTFNVTTPDADSFRRSETQLSAMLARAVGNGQRNL